MPSVGRVPEFLPAAAPQGSHESASSKRVLQRSKMDFARPKTCDLVARSQKVAARFSLVTLVYGSDAHANVIFLLTSLFIDSIHSISRNKIPLRESMNNRRENRSMATKKKAKKKKKH
jgi:hypothetical protein